MANRKKGRELLIWSGVLLLAALLRLVRLNQLPYGIHIDEVGMAYDSYYLAKEGVDRWCMSYPVYLLNYGSGQSALYAYLCMFLVKLTGGINPWIIRLPSVAFGMLTLLAGGLIIKELWGKRAALFGVFLMAVCPYFIMASRLGLDCNLFLGLSTLSIYLLIMAAEKGGLGWFAASGACFGLCLYTYVLSYLILPLFLLAAGVYFLRQHLLNLKKILAFAIPLGLLSIPLVLMIGINQMGLDSLHLGPVTIPRMFYYRVKEFGFYFTFERIRDLFLSIFFYDGEFCSSFPFWGTLFPWSVPLVLLGIIMMMRSCWKERENYKNRIDGRLLLLFFLVAQLLIACTIDEIFTYKVNAVFFILICCVVQCFHILDKRDSRLKIWGKRTVIVLYAAGGMLFAFLYFTKGNDLYAKGWYFKEPYEKAWNSNFNEFKGKNVYTDPSIAYFLYSTRIPPKEIAESMKKTDKVFLNIHFYLGMEYRENAAYIVSNGNTAYQERLSQWGYKKRYEDEKYNVWY